MAVSKISEMGSLYASSFYDYCAIFLLQSGIAFGAVFFPVLAAPNYKKVVLIVMLCLAGLWALLSLYVLLITFSLPYLIYSIAHISGCGAGAGATFEYIKEKIILK